MARDIVVRATGGTRVPIPYYPVDAVGVQERAASFSTRSIKKESKREALYLAVSMVDLTTLEGADTPGRVLQLAAKAKHPAPDFIFSNIKDAPPIPSVAAVCVYPNLVPVAAEALAGSGIEIAAVATAFPSGQYPTDLKLKDVSRTVALGATEIDMVIDRGAFLSGNYQKVFDEIQKVKEACGEKAHLKVILETGELQTFDKVRLASWLAMEAGADFIKTSTGKVSPAATMPVTLVMLQAIQDYFEETGRVVGMKPAGGIRTAKQAVHYLCMVNETLGSDWLHKDRFRFGASSLLNDLLKQIYTQFTGRYYYDDIFSID